jgi:type VI secretion system secreted protein VgrG
MSSTLAGEVLSALSEFSSHTRLYELTFKHQRNGVGLLVEAFAADEQLLGVGGVDVIALSTRAQIAHALLGQEASLQISLADGSRAGFTGYVSQVATLGSDGALSRYRLRLSPWIWLLSQARNSRAWQDKTVVEIIDSVFEPFQPYAQWIWSGEVASFMGDAVARSYCCQYRETDLDFVTRLLTEEGWPGVLKNTRAAAGWCCFPTAVNSAPFLRTQAVNPAAASATTLPVQSKRATAFNTCRRTASLASRW